MCQIHYLPEPVEIRCCLFLFQFNSYNNIIQICWKIYLLYVLQELKIICCIFNFVSCLEKLVFCQPVSNKQLNLYFVLLLDTARQIVSEVKCCFSMLVLAHTLVDKDRLLFSAVSQRGPMSSFNFKNAFNCWVVSTILIHYFS